MARTTERQLQAMCDRLNRALGRPLRPYVAGKAQIGCYHLDHSYGGVSVMEIVNDGGGCSHACGMFGSVPKAECERHLSGAIWAAELLTRKD